MPSTVTIGRLGYPSLLAFAFLLGWTSPSAAQPVRYEVEALTPGSPFRGVHGLTFDAQDRLWAGSVVGQSIHRVDPESGDVETVVGPPHGTADDLEFGPDGRLYWTQLFAGEVLAAHPGGEIQVLARDRTGINAIAFKPDGRLFASEVFQGDALYEIDPRGVEPPRRILSDIGGLNGFDFGPDEKLYGPLWFRREVVRIDVDTGEVETVARDFHTPAAANFDSKGRLWVLDTGLGHVYWVDISNGEKTLLAQLEPGLDNLALDSRDRLFVSNMASNGIYEVDTEIGEVRTVIEAGLALPAGLDLTIEEGSGAVLHVADTFAYRTIDLATNRITDVSRIYGGEVTNPLGISVGPRHVVISFFFENTLQVVDRDSTEVVGTRELDAPGGVLALADGRFLVAELGSGDLLEMDGDGRTLRKVTSGLSLPVALASTAPGKVIASESGAGRLVEIDLASGSQRTVADGLEQPEGIAVSPAGGVLVVEVGARRLTRIDLATGEAEVLASDLPVGLPAPDGVPSPFIPTGVAVSPSGTIYVSADLESTIYRLTPQEAQARRWR